MGPPKFFDASLPACHNLRTPADIHTLTLTDVSCWLRCTLKPSPSAIRISKLYQLSGHAVAPTAYRILCVRFTSFVRHQPPGSAVGATLDTGGWLALSRPGLSPGKMRQAYLGAVTPKLSRGLAGAKRRKARRLERLVGRYSSTKHVATHALSSTTWMAPRVIVTEIPSETSSFTR